MGMVYDATAKLKFNEDPVLKIKDVELTVRSDADVLLSLMDVMQKKGEMEGAREAISLLFSEKDYKKLQKLRLKMDDYMEVVRLAISLALGEDPDGEQEKN